jgi:LmbE family N-acetylglucosaminyl deacetylase
VIRPGSFVRGITILGIVIVVAAVFLEYQRRGGLYWYDVHDNYTYSFQQGSARKVPLQITSTGFILPDIDANWDTAVLPVQVEATLLGRWFEPYIELRSGDSRSVQYFDRGANGRRFLVLGPQLLKSGQSVSMSGVHVSWPGQGRELLLFDNPQASSARILVIAPHPDDAEIAAFGIYSETDAYVATVTAGDYVDDLYEHLEADMSERRLLRGRVRAWDSLVVPTWGGVPSERVVNLGYWNGSLSGLFEARDAAEPVADSDSPDPNIYRAGAINEMLGGRSARPTWQSLVGDLRVLIETVRPDTIIAPHPALDAAPDHQLTTVALLEALAASGETRALLLLYTNHHVLAEYFPFGPSGSATTLPPWFDDSLTFGGVFSYPVGPALRERKLFALDAMHDLRPAPRLVTGRDPVDRFFHAAANAVHNLRRNPVGTYSYYRRAIRENELFFVYRPEERDQIAQWGSQDFSYR